MEQKIQRADKEANSDLIRAAVLTILQDKQGRKPTTKELSIKTGLSVSAVKTHIKGMSFAGQVNKACSLRLLTDDVKLSLYRSAMDGNVSAMKLWFQIIEGWSEKMETKMDAKVQVENRPPVIIHID